MREVAAEKSNISAQPSEKSRSLEESRAALPISPDTPWLAPLAGFSDLSFRLLCRENGAAAAVTEMVSAKGFVYGTPGTSKLLRTCPEDAPLVVQLFGAEADFLKKTMEALREAGFRYFDLNCGCSVPKVTRTGSGAALLREPERLIALGQTLVRAAEPGCMGFKLRLGWNAGDLVFARVASELEQAGAGWITLHPRFATQTFGGVADWTHIRTLKERLRIPVIASGDLFTAEDGVRCLEQCGADSLMFARGALNDPMIFRRYLELRNHQTPRPLSESEIFELARRLYDFSTRFDVGKAGLLKMRTLIPRFMKGLPGARAIRSELVLAESWERVFEILRPNPRRTSASDAHLTGNQEQS